MNMLNLLLQSYEWPSEDGSSDYSETPGVRSDTQNSTKNKTQEGKKVSNDSNNRKVQKTEIDDWDEPEAKSSSNFSDDWRTSDSVVDNWSVAENTHSYKTYVGVNHDDWEPDLKGPAVETEKVKQFQRPNPLGSDFKPSNVLPKMGRGSKLNCGSSVVSDSSSVSALGRGSGAVLLNKRYTPAPPTTMGLGRGIGRGVSPAPPPGKNPLLPIN